MYSELFENNDDEDEEAYIRSLLPPHPPCPPLSSPIHQQLAIDSTTTTANSKKKKVPCECGRKKDKNDACDHGKVCILCCSEFPTRCRAPSHNKNKPGGGLSTKQKETRDVTATVTLSPTEISDRVNEAINKKHSIFIAYDNNNPTMKKNARKISPSHWEVRGHRFNAEVHYVGAPNDPKSKSFLIHRILRIENESWDPTSGILFHFYLLQILINYLRSYANSYSDLTATATTTATIVSAVTCQPSSSMGLEPLLCCQPWMTKRSTCLESLYSPTACNS